MIPKKSSMNKMRGIRPKTAEEDARRVRIVSGPSVVGHGAYTDDDFMSPSSGSEDLVVQPHQLHSLSAAVAAMGGYSTDTATSSTETDSDQSPTLTESSVTSASSGASNAQRMSKLKKHASQPQLNVDSADDADRTVRAARNNRPASAQLLPPANKTVRNSTSNTSLASGYRSDGGSSLGRSAEIPRGVGRNRVSIRGAASRQGTLQARIGPKAGVSSISVPRRSHAFNVETAPEPVSDDETEVMVPDGFGGHERIKQRRSQNTASERRPAPALLQRIDMTCDRPASESSASRPEMLSREPTAKWRVGSFYGPDGSETARFNHEAGTITELSTQYSISDAGHAPMQPQSVSDRTSVSLSRSQTSSNGPKASLMQSPSRQPNIQADQAQDSTEGPLEGSTKAAAAEQNRMSRTSLASVSMRSKRGLQGLEEAERGGALVSLDHYRMTYDTGMLSFLTRSKLWIKIVLWARFA